MRIITKIPYLHRDELSARECDLRSSVWVYENRRLHFSAAGSEAPGHVRDHLILDMEYPVYDAISRADAFTYIGVFILGDEA